MITKEQKDNCRKLIEALRSNKYKQATGCRLKEAEDKFCVLGLALEVFRQETGEGYWQVYDDGIFVPPWERFYSDEDNYSASLVMDFPEVRDYYGFKSAGVGWACGYMDFLGLNSNKISFSEMADMIETELSIL